MYSALPLEIIDDHFSYLDAKQIFCGQYWDEFGLMAHLVPDGARVLILGLASGGGVRPLLSSGKKFEITGVDLDPLSVKRCGALFKKHFPQIHLNLIAAEAAEFLKQTIERKEKYDAIWIDLYTNEAYAPVSLEKSFYQLAKAALKEEGLVMMNAYGIPNFRYPNVSDGIQSQIGIWLNEQFCFLRAVPYRRNLTFIASNQAIQRLPASPSKELKPKDAMAFRSLALRLTDDYVPHLSQGSVSPYFADLNLNMAKQWWDLAAELSKFGVSIEHPKVLVDVVEGRLSLPLNQIFQHEPSLLNFLPIFAAGESQMRELELDWLFKWFLESVAELKHQAPILYRQIWLSQLWSICLQANNRFEKFKKPIENLIIQEIL